MLSCDLLSCDLLSCDLLAIPVQHHLTHSTLFLESGSFLLRRLEHSPSISSLWVPLRKTWILYPHPKENSLDIFLPNFMVLFCRENRASSMANNWNALSITRCVNSVIIDSCYFPSCYTHTPCFSLVPSTRLCAITKVLMPAPSTLHGALRCKPQATPLPPTLSLSFLNWSLTPRTFCFQPLCLGALSTELLSWKTLEILRYRSTSHVTLPSMYCISSYPGLVGGRKFPSPTWPGYMAVIV